MRKHISRFIFLQLVAVLAVALVPAPSAAAADLPESPDGTIKAIYQKLADRHPEIIWQALPASYQQDITDVTRAFAGKMDPEIWNSLFGLANKTVDILRDKKQYILESSFMDAAGDEKVRIEQNWDTVVAILDDLFSSEISDLEKLETIDWEELLKTTGAEIMDSAQNLSTAKSAEEKDKDLTTLLRQSKIETISHEGNTATVLVSTPGEEPEDISLTLVEGRWVPTDMAQDWDTKIAEAKEKIATMSEEEMAQNKMQAMMMFGMADGMLGELAQVSSKEEFEQAIQGILGPMMGMGGDVMMDMEMTGEDE